MGRLTRSLPQSVKHLAPVVRERDVLRAKVAELRAQLAAERARPLAAPPARLHGGYVGDGRVLIGPKWGGRLMLPSDDISLMPELMTEGTYDVPFTAYVQRHIKPGDTVIDVGAHVGLFTLLLGFQVWEHGHVLAYEANPRIVEFLRDNVAMNWLNDRVEIVPKAAAATADELKFSAPRRFSMTGSLQPVEHLLVSDDRLDTLEEITVPAEPLDVHAGRFDRIALIKIDVEGAEEQVFAGMTGLLESGVVERVSFEVASEHMGDDWEPFKERLRSLVGRGWTFGTIASSGEREPIEPDTVFERGRFSQILMSRPPASAGVAVGGTPTAAQPAREFPSGWDDWHRRRLVAERHFVPWVERVMPLEGRTVLEYGSGNGPVTAAFAPLAGRFIGVDIAAEDVELSRQILAEGGLHPELHSAPPSEILKLTGTFRGEVDVFLCAAVLEHMSVDERLALLRLAREVVRPDGIVVVFETPNRLTPWDYHTSRLPFLNQLPEDLALAYLQRSPRADFVEAMRAAVAQGEEAERETYVRWGRGMSFHELELVFDDLPRHVVASSWDPLLLGEREVYRDELALQRVLDQARPDLPAAFSRYWLDFILAATPRDEPERFLRPWQLRTTGSRGVEYDAAQYVGLDGPDAVLAVELPAPSDRLVIGSEGLDAPLVVRVSGSGEEQLGTLEPGRASYADLRFGTPAASFEVRLSAPGAITLVLYEG